MKRIVCNCVSWRGPSLAVRAETTEAPSASKKKRPYESCAMLQLLRSVVAQERIWQTPQLAGGGLSVAQRRLLARHVVKQTEGCHGLFRMCCSNI